MKRDQVREGTVVKYEGLNREYLKSYPKAQLTEQYSSNNNSALVEFLDKDGLIKDIAWVGLDYLSVVAYTHQDTINDLTAKRDALQVQIDGFNAAIKALQDLG